MAVNSQHPHYMTFLSDWEVCDDAYRGERRVKGEKTKYLPATQNMVDYGMESGNEGRMAYDAYRLRAVFPDFFAMAVEAAIGVMHRKPPTIELPAAMEPMREMATLHGESLEMLLRRINEQQLVTGRLGLLLDLPAVPSENGLLPYIALYHAKNILNWDDGMRESPVLQNLNMVALDESEFERQDDFEWEWEMKTRVLILGDPRLNEPMGQGTYNVGLYRDEFGSFDINRHTVPSIRGNTLDEIPFVFINSKDIVPTPDDPPLLGLANLAMSIYRGEADYRQCLFMQGQDTLVVIGGVSGSEDARYRTGAGAVIELSQGSDAKFIGVDSQGLPEMRQSLENDRMIAMKKSGQMLNLRGGEAESGDALRIRQAAETATLNQVAVAGAFGLERILRMGAKWLGANPDEVVVTPNLDFADDKIDGQTLVQYVTAKKLGAPWSDEQIHARMQERGLTELTYEEEVALLDRESEEKAEEAVDTGATEGDGDDEELLPE